MKFSTTSLAIAILATGVTSIKVPYDVHQFYKRILNGKCTGGKVLKDGFYSQTDGPKNFAYCQDDKTDIIYIHGAGNQFPNMDIDCDGDQSDQGDGRCYSSTDTQSQTAFRDTVKEYSHGNVADINANFIPFVVFGNYGSTANYTTFNPQDYGIQPLSVMAVVCGDQLIYGVWGDTNGDDGPALVGEVSIALGTACYGTQAVNGNKAHEANDILYLAFPGSVEETVQKNAAWSAKSFRKFQKSIKGVGDRLIKRVCA